MTTATIDTIVAGDCAAGYVVPAVGGDDLDQAFAAADILLESARTSTDLLPCRMEDADLWFSETASELEQAKQFCAECPVKRVCLAGALARHEPWGVWGGEIFERGVVIARKRPRGRPRKDAAEIAA